MSLHCLFPSGWINEYLFYTLSYTTSCCCCVIWPQFGCWELFHVGSCVLLKYLILLFCLFLNTFWISGITRCSRLLLCISYPSHRFNISPRGLDTLYSRMVLKIKTWVLGINHLNGNTMLLTKYIIVQVGMKLNNLWFDLPLFLPPPTKNIIYIV